MSESKTRSSIHPSKLLADLLKRKIRSALRDVTTCSPECIPAFVERLDDLRDIACHLLRHELRETPESSLSGCALQYAATLADWLVCVEYARKNHRQTAGLPVAPDGIAEIKRMLDSLAGLFASSNRAREMFVGQSDDDSLADALMEEHWAWGRRAKSAGATVHCKTCKGVFEPNEFVRYCDPCGASLFATGKRGGV